jgi:hypothetical protein
MEIATTAPSGNVGRHVVHDRERLVLVRGLLGQEVASTGDVIGPGGDDPSAFPEDVRAAYIERRNHGGR